MFDCALHGHGAALQNPGPTSLASAALPFSPLLPELYHFAKLWDNIVSISNLHFSPTDTQRQHHEYQRPFVSFICGSQTFGQTQGEHSALYHFAKLQATIMSISGPSYQSFVSVLSLLPNSGTTSSASAALHFSPHDITSISGPSYQSFVSVFSLLPNSGTTSSASAALHFSST